MHQGLWTSVADAPVHINAKELMALHIFLRDFLPLCDAPLSLWRTDSSTSMVYIQREGGTVSRPLLRLACQILLLAHWRQIHILPVLFSSEENHLAEAASRFQTLPDWSLPTEVFHQMIRRWTLLDINLFATSSLILRFFAWGYAPEAEALDALPQPWNFRLAYAFPLPSLLRVVRKMAVSGIFLLVTPFWPAQKWFPAVLGLQVMDVHRLPTMPEVINLTSGLPLYWRSFKILL